MAKEKKATNLVDAVLNVMEEVKWIEKNLSVWTWKSSYKWVSDKDVKKIIGDAMKKNGLVIFPIWVEEETKVSRWEEDTNYWIKQKQSVFTSVRTKYILKHTSGESQELMWYGHGVDSQDKSAGKATTYALKYLLLYTFLVPTGSIDDADTINSKDIKEPIIKKDYSTFGDDKIKIIKALLWGKKPKEIIDWIKKKMKLDKSIEGEINSLEKTDKYKELKEIAEKEKKEKEKEGKKVPAKAKK